MGASGHAYERDSPSSSAASAGVRLTSAGIVMTARPAARLFAALTTSRKSDGGRLISVPSAVRRTSQSPLGVPAGAGSGRRPPVAITP
jgi:hypothetical protein